MDDYPGDPIKYDIKYDIIKYEGNLAIRLNTFRNIDNYDYSDNNECIDYVNINICDNCSDKLSNNYIQLPHKYIKGIFYVSNVFCSFECCCRYCIDNYSDPFEYISLLNLHYLYFYIYGLIYLNP